MSTVLWLPIVCGKEDAAPGAASDRYAPGYCYWTNDTYDAHFQGLTVRSTVSTRLLQ